MKKMLSLALALAVCLSLAACGGDSGGSSSGTQDQSSQGGGSSQGSTSQDGSSSSGDSSAPEVVEDLAYVQDKGTLVVGITEFDPMDYQNADGNWIGFDADMARAFAESLGVTAEFQLIEWDNKVMELDGKTIDVVWNGMTLTDEVTSSMDCTNAYCSNAQVVVLPADVAGDYPDAASMSVLSFAVESGSAGQAQAEENSFTFTPVVDQATAVMEVASGTADAAIIDKLMASAMVGEGTSYDGLVYTIELNSEEYGVGFRQGSDLTEMLNQFFVDSYADGTMLEIAETYGIQGAIIPQE